MFHDFWRNSWLLRQLHSPLGLGGCRCFSRTMQLNTLYRTIWNMLVSLCLIQPKVYIGVNINITSKIILKYFSVLTYGTCFIYIYYYILYSWISTIFSTSFTPNEFYLPFLVYWLISLTVVFYELFTNSICQKDAYVGISHVRNRFRTSINTF